METLIEDIRDTLLTLKEQALDATKNSNTAFYQSYLSDDAIAIVPFGVFNKDALVQQMGSSNSPFQSKRIDDTRVIVLSPESGIVTYKATYESKSDQKEFTVFVTTVYSRIDGKWKGVFYQQTPLQEGQS